MKIVIPVNDKSMNTTVCQSFGRTPFFLVYNTETQASEFIDNTAAASQGGAGIKAAQSIVDVGAQALLTPRCGENAAQVLQAANIKLFRTVGSDIMENIQQYLKGSLQVLVEIHEGFHHHGGN